MRVFLIGGTKFTGPPLIRELAERGHQVSFFHRGETPAPSIDGAEEILGERGDRKLLAKRVRERSPEALVDMIPFTARDAEGTRDICRGVVPRVVALSSIDVYLAYGRIHRTEPGPVQETPLREDAALRETDQPQGPGYDKIAVERILLADENEFAATILRLPAIYGPGDRLRRLRGYLKRMDDGREVILLGKTMAGWKFSRGYVDIVAHAVALAVESKGESSANRIYNVAESPAQTELEFVRSIAAQAGWGGEIRVMADERLPSSLRSDADFTQDWEVDTRRIRTELGYSETTSREEAIGRTIQWEREHPPEEEPYPGDYDEEDAAI